MPSRTNPQNTASQPDEQYSLAKILTIWAVVSIPMPILAFIVAPAIAGESSGIEFTITVWLLMIGGMIWQFVVSVWILYRELDEFTWEAIKDRLWLHRPSHPKTGKKSYWLFLWLIPAFLFYAAIEQTVVADYLGEFLFTSLPFLHSLPELDLSQSGSPELIGAWWLLGVALVSNIFNYVLGEELFFRGILLPKMRGAFGKWDFVANSVLFAVYHLHKPWVILPSIIGGLAFTWTSREFKSIWFAIILHGFEGVVLIAIVFAVVSGLAF